MTKSVEHQEKDYRHLASSPSAIVIGSLVDIDADGKPLVNFADNPDNKPLFALTTLSLSRQDISRKVALLFNNGDLTQPVIMGLIHNPLDEILQNFELTPVVESETNPFPEAAEKQHKPADIKRDKDEQVFVDGKHVVIEGAEEVTFKCGKASITLTKAGKILIRGTYLLNRSTGVNRIMGGSVQVN